MAAIVGGTVSQISGGSFANGAVTAAMQHLYNDESNSSKKTMHIGGRKVPFVDKNSLVFDKEITVHKLKKIMERLMMN